VVHGAHPQSLIFYECLSGSTGFDSRRPNGCVSVVLSFFSFFRCYSLLRLPFGFFSPDPGLFSILYQIHNDGRFDLHRRIVVEGSRKQGQRHVFSTLVRPRGKIGKQIWTWCKFFFCLSPSLWKLISWLSRLYYYLTVLHLVARKKSYFSRLSQFHRSETGPETRM
jgi:hypothetical protein